MKKHILNILLVKTLTLSSIDSVVAAAAAAEWMPDEPIRSGQVHLTMNIDRYNILIFERPENASLIRGVLESDRMDSSIDPTIINSALSGDYELFKLLFDLVGDDIELSRIISRLANEEGALDRYKGQARDAELARQMHEAEQAAAADLEHQEAEGLAAARALYEQEQAAAADLERQEAEGLAAARALYEQEQAAAAGMGAAAAAAAAPMEAEAAVVYDIDGVALRQSMAKLIDQRMPMWRDTFINGVRDAENNRIGTPAEWRNLIARGGFFDKEVLDYLQSEAFKEFSVGKNMAEVTDHITERFPL